MSWRGTLVALAIALTAFLFLLLSDRSRTHSPSEPLLGIDPGMVDRIDIRENSQNRTLLGKDGNWTIQGSVTDRADPSVVHALLSKITDTLPRDILGGEELKGAVSLEALDLKVPKRSITVTAGKKRTLSFGIPGPASGEIYARLDSGREVFLIPRDLESLAFMPEEKFRDTRLTSFPPDRVSVMSLAKNGGLDRLSIKKESGEWILTAPTSTTADPAAAEAWTSAMLRAKIERWMPAETDPSTCGLDTPMITVTVEGNGNGEGGQTVTIAIGSPVPGATDKFFVKCSDRPGICVVTGLAPALEMTANSLRSKHLKRVELDAVDKLEIKLPEGNAGGTISQGALVLTRKPGGDDWEIRSGGEGILSGDRVRAWHEGLMKAKAMGFVPATPDQVLQNGLDHPTEIRLIARLSENSAEENAGEIVLGDYYLGRATNGGVALRDGNSPELMIMPECVLIPLIKPPEATSGPDSIPKASPAVK
jgi:hypothetical protein